MELDKQPEVILWRAVILQAAKDAIANETKEQCGAERIYAWSKSVDCKEVCSHAQMNHKDVRLGIAKIYIDFLWEQLRIKKRKMITEGYKARQVDLALKPIRRKLAEATTRKELIECQKL